METELPKLNFMEFDDFVDDGKQYNDFQKYLSIFMTKTKFTKNS